MRSQIIAVAAGAARFLSGEAAKFLPVLRLYMELSGITVFLSGVIISVFYVMLFLLKVFPHRL